jgi:hypothetical protein
MALKAKSGKSYPIKWRHLCRPFSRAAFLIGKTINKYGLSQRAAAVKLGVAQPDVSRILNGLVDRFTLEKLVWKPMASSFAAAWSLITHS